MKRKLRTVLIITAICMLVTTVAAFATAGDEGDPLITLSYITDVLLPDIDSRIDKKVDTSVNEAMSNGEGSSFVLVNVDKNQKIIGDEGTEFLLRAGDGTIIATSQGGVADLTDGVDLSNGTQVPLNHHLLVPRNDQRGMAFTTDAIVMVKGTYQISKK